MQASLEKPSGVLPAYIVLLCACHFGSRCCCSFARNTLWHAGQDEIYVAQQLGACAALICLNEILDLSSAFLP